MLPIPSSSCAQPALPCLAMPSAHRRLGPRKASALLRAVMRVGGFVESRAQVGWLHYCHLLRCIAGIFQRASGTWGWQAGMGWPACRWLAACFSRCLSGPASPTQPGPDPAPCSTLPSSQVWRELGVFGNRVFRNAAAYLRIRASTKGKQCAAAPAVPAVPRASDPSVHSPIVAASVDCSHLHFTPSPCRRRQPGP